MFPDARNDTLVEQRRFDRTPPLADPLQERRAVPARRKRLFRHFRTDRRSFRSIERLDGAPAPDIVIAQLLAAFKREGDAAMSARFFLRPPSA